MPSAVDDTKPAANSPRNAQEIRDNFAAVKAEITALQAAAPANSSPTVLTGNWAGNPANYPPGPHPLYTLLMDGSTGALQLWYEEPSIPFAGWLGVQALG